MNWFNNLIANMLPIVPRPIVRIFSRPYLAGETLDDAVRVVKELNTQGMCATLDLLGEEVKSKEDSLKALETYKQILTRIDKEKLDANVSVKPTHMGLKLDKEFCYNNIKSLVEQAKQLDNFVRIDMEDSSCVDDTIEVFLRLRNDYDNIGTVFQAYLRRLLDDINATLPQKPNLRLCKGAYYWEKRMEVFKEPEIVNCNFGYALEKLLTNGCYIGIATHDEKVVWQGLKLIDQLQLTPDQYEFQMLLGVDPELRRIIVSQGHKLRVYVPFGKEWFAYSVRRLKENPKMVNYIIGNLFNKILGRKQ